MALNRQKDSVFIGLLLVDRMASEALTASIRDYAASHSNWQVIAALYPRAGQHLVANWSLSGIFFGGDADWLPVIQNTPIPKVSFDYKPSATQCPRVIIDDDRTVDLVIEHFTDRRFKHFAFAGYHDELFSLERERLYRHKLQQRGDTPHIFTRSIRNPGQWARPALAQWLARLPKPVGIFLCHDRLAFPIIDACRSINVAIPQEVAFVGVDNLTVHCELIRPTVSSVIYPNHEIGRRAAILLDRMITEEFTPPDVVRVPPPGIATRTSSDIHHHGDPLVADALDFIRCHAADNLGVDDILGHLAISRSSLERVFRRVLNTTPLYEIHRAKVMLARNLLLQTKLPTRTIAGRAGFRNASHLSIIFKQITGQSPSAFRAQSAHDRIQR